MPTATSNFGVGRRENHDAAGFYRRFRAPVLSTDDRVAHPDERPVVDEILHGTVQERAKALAPRSVALVVTSPPYYSGKAYEEEIGSGGVPESYEAFLSMLHGVFAACVDALEPGGRIAVNVANLGRKPYRSLSRDVIDIFEDLGLLLRGEIVWRKARGAAGSCAWGTYQRPGDPVLRDLTERVVVASKGRFDRAVDPRAREARGLPAEATLFRDEFLEATTDVWEIAPESAVRVQHPAPFPVELPQRLIDLYTYRNDLVVDPFMGSGSTAVAAVRTDRRFVGFDVDSDYVRAATARVRLEQDRLGRAHGVRRPSIPARPASTDPAESAVARGLREGRQAKEVARWLLAASAPEQAFVDVADQPRLANGLEATFGAHDAAGRGWLFEVVGAFSATDAGLRRAEALWRTIGKASVAHALAPDQRFVVITTARPAPGSSTGRALSSVCGPGLPIFDVVELTSEEDWARLYAQAIAGSPTGVGGASPKRPRRSSRT
jgi:DNA modification methylase